MALKKAAALCAMLMLSGLCGCIAVGYTSSGGWFVWPPVGIILVLLLVLLLMRRR